jgi:hypothetical protein
MEASTTGRWQAVAEVVRRWMRRQTPQKNLGFFGVSRVEKGHG